MQPTIAIIGRTNTGKSSLFNRLVRESKSLTHDRPGVTRDRIYGLVRLQDIQAGLVDTGGIDLTSSGTLEELIFSQAREAMEEADLILFLVDGRAGLTPLDSELSEFLRKSNKPLLLVVNKVDGPELESRFCSEFYSLGHPLLACSAAHGFGVGDLLEALEDKLKGLGVSEQWEKDKESGLKLALLGRPNVGKSSLINALVGENRLIVNDQAGTTRDNVDIVLQRGTSKYIFLDTAGVRRKSRVRDSLERFSALRALKCSKRAQVTILVLDALQGLTVQDKKLLSFLDREKTPLILAVNKIDLIPRKQKEQLKKYFQHELSFCSHVPVIYTSSVNRSGLGGILPLADKLQKECSSRISTGELNRMLKKVEQTHQPPMVKGRRLKLYYLTQAESSPPVFVIFVNDASLLKPAYKRYLERQIRKVFGFNMSPIQLVFRTSQG